jgi:hypothetical protein
MQKLRIILLDRVRMGLDEAESVGTEEGENAKEHVSRYVATI